MPTSATLCIRRSWTTGTTTPRAWFTPTGSTSAATSRVAFVRNSSGCRLKSPAKSHFVQDESVQLVRKDGKIRGYWAADPYCRQLQERKQILSSEHRRA